MGQGLDPVLVLCEYFQRQDEDQPWDSLPARFRHGEMRPLIHGTPRSDEDREACDAATCRYSGGRDLVEEMVAAKSM